MLFKTKTQKPKKPSSLELYLAQIGTEEEKDYFLENLAMLVATGTTIFSAIESIKNETNSKGMRMILTSLQEDVENGNPLWKAIENSKMFDESTIALLKLGEESGQLSQNLNIVILRQRRERSFKSKIRSAMLYPVFVLFLAFVIGVGIAWFMLPKLAKVFADLKLKLPLMTRILIAIGMFIEKHGAVVVPAVIIGVFLLLYFVFIYRKTKFIGEWFMFLFPPVRRIIQDIELSQLGFVLGTLLKAGLPITNSIEALGGSAGSRAYHRLYQFLEQSIKEGNSFQKSFFLYPKIKKLIPYPQQHMIVAAEQSGKLEETFLQLGEIYEEKTDTATKNIAVLLEPVMLVIVWLAVVFVALAVIMPIYSLVGGLNQDNNGQASSSSSSVAQVSQPNVATENVVVDANNSEVQNNDQQTSPDQKANLNQQQSKLVEILPTETGSLNVRQSASQNSKILTKVLPGEAYVFKGMENEWVKIELADGQEGWISKKYAKMPEVSNDNSQESVQSAGN